jgi:hypothetical protein
MVQRLRLVVATVFVIAGAIATVSAQPARLVVAPGREAVVAPRREAALRAQTPNTGSAPTTPADVPEALTPPVLADMMDTYAIVQAKQALSIDDDKYATFAARLKKLQDIRRRNQRARIRIVQELRRLTSDPKGAEATPVDESAIKAQLTALREHDARAATELRQAYDSLDEILDPRQQARFRVFEEQIERRKLDLIVRATRDRGRANRQ